MPIPKTYNTDEFTFCAGILMLRTYAIWERKRGVLFFLCGLALVRFLIDMGHTRTIPSQCAFLPIVVFVRIETQTLNCASIYPSSTCSCS
jgi:hypothetical protein